MDSEKKHEKYMAMAINQAKKALAHNEVPIGAVVVDENGTVIGRGYNKMEKLKCQTGHAEVIAIQKACKKINDWRLTNCWLYVTLEPCSMCFGLAQLSRLKGVVFGTTSPLFGFGYENYKKTLPLTKKDMSLLEGVKKDECTLLLQNFFQTIRKKKDK
jgi:tRNA(adenine34) deaminase